MVKMRGVADSQNCHYCRLATLAAIYQRPGLIIIGLFDKNAAWRALIKRPGFAADAGGEGDTWRLLWIYHLTLIRESLS